ncbi:hypothetical protein CLV97_10695 [Planifilum fimeticola]|jgi:hypothetical protein|uniref:Uncharacterized protein n=1 Tax=Planifilum fimeticola TaxID=201975 RepID=A0A2T0LGQ2_9BACL|nr:hypothetical protein [Planifilum fimeticola]PRX41485.1 hypothetical protein CLV97_10695 [Planifilum fimeticola]
MTGEQEISSGKGDGSRRFRFACLPVFIGIRAGVMFVTFFVAPPS